MPKAVVYLRRPQVAATFHVDVTRLESGQALVTGADAERVLTFIRRSAPTSHFDLEWDGTVFERCELQEEAPESGVMFKYGAKAATPPFKSEPTAG